MTVDGRTSIELSDIIGELDTLFRIDTFQPDSPFSHLVPSAYEGTGIQLQRYLESAFLEAFHGLMIRSGQAVEWIYTTVFLGEEVVSKLFAQEARNALLISHHPLSMETGGRGFLPLPEDCLQGMRKRGISVYIAHTPLDAHDRISPSRALAREVGLGKLKGYYRFPAGYAGIYGRLDVPIPFHAFLDRVRDASRVPDPHFIHNWEDVQRVGVIAGGTGVEGILETVALGCDTFLTGTYYNLVQNEIGQRYRDEFDAIRDDLTINLVECSHYASEAVVMWADLLEWCRDRFRLPCTFVPQDDPWY